MSPINDGGPAFPVPDTYHPNGQVQFGSSGMSLRDYFAAHASEQDIEEHLGGKISPKTGRKMDCLSREKAKFAYADAMIKARSVATTKASGV
jgi:hypothetical protein